MGWKKFSRFVYAFHSSLAAGTGSNPEYTTYTFFVIYASIFSFDVVIDCKFRQNIENVTFLLQGHEIGASKGVLPYLKLNQIFLQIL